MFIKICLLGAFSICALALPQQLFAQKTSALPAAAEMSDREKDGLSGPVRRVTVESAKIAFKNGVAVETPRVIAGITTYDARGRRLDTVAYPVETTTLPGKEQYKYDDKGNIIEMELRAPDGSMISKEVYKYELDELGNWKKMVTSLAVYEDGKVNEEPVDITYRTITYFFSQQTAKLVSDPAKKLGATAFSSSNSNQPGNLNQIVTQSDSVQPANTTKAEPAFNRSGEKATNTVLGSKSVDSTSARTESASLTRADSSPVIPVRHVSEDVLRKAALSLPQPVYPEAAELARAEGRVDVEVIVDEKGRVTSARGTSTLPLLNEAAEAAARAARFSPSSLSPETGKLTGTLSYNFVLPLPKPTEELAAKPAADKKQSSMPKETSPSVNADRVALPATAAASTKLSVPEESQNASYYYKLGTTYFEGGKLAEAAEALNQAVYKDPEFVAAYQKLGIAYTSMGRHKDAVAVFKMALRVKNDVLDPEGYFQLGRAYAALNKNSEAASAFKQALYTMRAQAIGSDEQKPAATNPSALEVHYSLGLAYHNLGKYRDAIKEIQEVIAINPRLAEAYYGLAMSYLALGDRKAAENQQKTLETLNPELARKVAGALAISRVTPPGVSEGILGRRQ